MAVQLDDGGGGRCAATSRRSASRSAPAPPRPPCASRPTAGSPGCPSPRATDLDADIVVFAAGIRPRDQLAGESGLQIGERGGIVVDDRCATSAPDVYAIGEVACHGGRVYGLVAPGYGMAEVVADRLAGGDATFTGADMSTKLKLLGVEVASVGNPHADGRRRRRRRPGAGTWQRVIVDPDGRVARRRARRRHLAVPDARAGRARHRQRPDVLDLLRPTAGAAGTGPADLPDEAGVCSCHNVSCGAVRAAVDEGFEDVAGVKGCTKAGTGCGSCVPVLQELIDARLAAAGKAVVKRLCAHFAMTRPELFEVVRVTGIRTFAELVARHGKGAAARSASRRWPRSSPRWRRATSSTASRRACRTPTTTSSPTSSATAPTRWCPACPGGEITPAQLIAIGEVARDFDLYTKITGGQRIDLFGARVEQLPRIWERLIDAGLESGHAYGKALRTVKSCVGTTWCRYGVQDSVQMAIDLELRYRGLRVAAQDQDRGVRAAPASAPRRRARTSASSPPSAAGTSTSAATAGCARPTPSCSPRTSTPTTLVRSIDRYLMWYVRTAERLERTATWQRKLPGGIDFVRRVVLDDALGIGAELEADMARHVDSYECEWAATLDDPDRLAALRHVRQQPGARPDRDPRRDPRPACPGGGAMTAIDETAAARRRAPPAARRLGRGLRARAPDARPRRRRARRRRPGRGLPAVRRRPARRRQPRPVLRRGRAQPGHRR